MKLPDKFWFYHSSFQGEIYFAEKADNQYVITGESLEGTRAERPLAEVEEYFNLGYWVLTVPGKFCVRGTVLNKEFSASEYHDGSFVVQDKAGEGSYFFGREEVLTNLYDIPPRWEILENTAEKPAQESPLKRLISININDVRATAEFDVANNPHTKANVNTIEEVEQEILGYLKEMYDALMNGDTEWELHYTGTRTYRILFQPEDDHYGTISILSDTSVGMPTFFADVNDFLSQN